MRRVILGVVLLLLIVGVGLAAYRLGFLPPEPQAAEVERVSPAAAASAEMKLAQLDSEGEVRLTAEELTSLFRYRPEIWSLGILREPVVRIAGDTVHLSGSVASADLPPHPEIDQLLPFLPDTAAVDIRGTIEPFDSLTTLLQVGAIEVARMPIPLRFFSPFLERLGRADPGLPPGSVALPLPDGIGAVRPEGGDLVLTR